MRKSIVAIILMICLVTFAAAQGEKKGHFVGDLIWRPLADGRLMQLMEPFGYVDAEGKAWNVSKGTQVDGASIPQALWSVVGSPFTGKYRTASVIHDHYCVVKTSTWQATHRVFYEAMLDAGESVPQAKLMNFAVMRFGLRWDWRFAPITGPQSGGFGIGQLTSSPFDQEEFDRFRRVIESNDIALDDIERKADADREGKEIVVCRRRVPDASFLRCK